ncbi:hypothetical protein ACSNOI_16790 [Actinomadura kijaniata]|uniref:hypothetical protein n=1 Tax=Actinomadura kijaniata TaxID=46161 RepID=UPI003F1D8E3C
MAGMTLRALTARLVELGLVTPRQAENGLASADHANTEQSPVHLAGELVEYGLGVHADNGDVDSLEEEYENTFTQAAACSGLTVSDVELVENAETVDGETGKPTRSNSSVSFATASPGHGRWSTCPTSTSTTWHSCPISAISSPAAMTGAVSTRWLSRKRFLSCTFWPPRARAHPAG